MKWQELPTLVRRSFLEFLYAKDDGEWKYDGRIREDGLDILIGASRGDDKLEVRVKPDGRVETT